MSLFPEILILSSGILVNFSLVLNILVRPVLWSTTNTFIGFLLTCNLVFLSFQTLLIEEETGGNVDENVILRSLEFLFSDHSNTIKCSAKYISQFLHGSLALQILVGTIFIR